MPRNMSFAETKPQMIDRSKTNTRRLGWWHLRVGERLNAVEKAMGLKKGEKIKRIGLIEVISLSAEPLNAITQEDVIAEGFPDWTPQQFIDFFCKFNKCPPDIVVNSIKYKHIDEVAV